MKKALVFISLILFIVICSFIFLGIRSTAEQEERLIKNIERQARAYAESQESAAKNILKNKNFDLAAKESIKFKKKHAGSESILYDENGKVFSNQSEINDTNRQNYISEIISNKTPKSQTTESEGRYFYSYVLPLYSDGGNALGAIEIITDKTFVKKILFNVWKSTAIVLFIMFLFISAAFFLFYRNYFILPVLKITKWFENFQKGGNISSLKNIEDEHLSKLAGEVEQTALKLKIAKKNAAKEAYAKITKNELWTEARLRDLIKAKLGGNGFYVVSNREPYMHIKVKDKYKVVKPASGIVTALDPVLRACGGLWVAAASGDADGKFVNSKNMLGVPPGDEQYILKRVKLSKEEENGYYYGFSNEGLWPLCHITHTKPVFREEDWQYYKEVNQKFADNLLEELPFDAIPYIFIQDYHFTLLPKMIKDKRPDAVIALFWHIPWPNPEVMSICPYLNEIIDGMLGCDLIGFHIQYHCNNFMDLANKLLESRVDNEKYSITKSDKETLVRPFPISVSAAENKHLKSAVEEIKKTYDLKGKKIILSVERMDYTKGIPEKIDAIEKFLEQNPQYKEKVVFIQIASPSRAALQTYKDLIELVDKKIKEVNAKYSTEKWTPILYFLQNFSADEIEPYYKLSDVCIVSSLHDGMNLVAKEYISFQYDNKGVLILSQFTGASKELTDAIIINPYSTEEFASAIKTALDMPEEEIILRMSAMRELVFENNVYKWAGDIINELLSINRKV